MAYQFTAACTGTSGEFISVSGYTFSANVTEIIYIYYIAL